MDPLWIQRAPIRDEVLQRIFESDQDMYPAPLPYARLRSWVDECPDLCICFQQAPEKSRDVALVGAIIVLPLLKRHWDDVLVGKLKETDIDPATFSGKGEVDVGLHVFHIERFDVETRGTRFTEAALDAIDSVVKNKDWNVLGYSALTATAAGRAVFKRMGFTPTGYEELFVTDPDAAGSNVNMIYVYPAERNPPKATGTIHGKSQMVARYAGDIGQNR